MRQIPRSQRIDRPRRFDLSQRKGSGVAALLMGLVGFGLGLFFGWVLRRERGGGAGYAGASGDRATTALADTSARLELADQDVVDLRAQLTDAQHLLDERAATIAQLEAELAAYRGDAQDEVSAADAAALDDEYVDAAADAATAPDAMPEVDEFDVDETEVTDEVVAPPEHVEPAEEVVVEEPVAVQEEPVVVEDEPAAVAVPAEEVVVEEPVAVEEEPVPAEPVAVDEPVAVRDEPAAVAVPVDETAAAVAPSGAVADEGPFVPPPDAQPDDLRRIRGIGPAMERLLNEQGIVTFQQLAQLNDAGITELEKRLPGVPGRVRRDRWVEQAHKLHVETHGEPI